MKIKKKEAKKMIELLNDRAKYSLQNMMFAIEYGLESISRKAYFQIERDEKNETVEGHIYEFIKYKDKWV